MSTIAEYYRERYAALEGTPGLELQQTFEPRIDFALSTLGTTPKRVLDFGCNTGAAARRMVEAGHEVVGVDISASAIRIAEKRVSGARFLQLDEESKIPLPDASFDVCYCSEVIEHLFDVRGFLGEIHRLLRDSGQFLITTPYHGWLKNLLVITLRFEQHFSPTGGHIRFFSRKSLAQCLQETGFEIEALDGTGRIWPLWQSMLVTARRKP